MGSKVLKKITAGVLENIGIIYLFILPVYFPIRALGFELNAYSLVLYESYKLILFFSQITILIAFTGILLSFFMDYVNKKYFKSRENLIIHWYRFIAVLFGMAFIFSSYFMLNPTNKFQLYFWSGAHYFIISFFQLLIRAELNTYKNNPEISVPLANHYFGFALNMVGIVSIVIFGWFYENHNLGDYSRYCVYLELIFVAYLLYVRGYRRDCLQVVSTFGWKRVSLYTTLVAIALILSACLSVLVMSLGVLIPILTIIAIVGIYINFKKSLRTDDLNLLVNISLGYGLILAVFSGSVLTYFLHHQQSSIDLFNFTCSSEPFFSLILSVFLVMSLLRGEVKTEYSRSKLYQHTYYINSSVPLFFLIFYYSLATEKHLGLLLTLMFAVYAFIEYMSLFFMRQVAQLSEYNNFQGTRLTSFNVIALNGLCPSLIYLSVYGCSKLTTLSLDAMLINTVFGLLILSLVYNYLFKRRKV